MNQNLRTWFSATTDNPSDEYLQRRWKVIRALGRSLTVDRALDLVRLAANLRPINKGLVTDIRNRIVALEPSFPTNGRDFEIATIAGAAVANTLQSTEKSAVTDVVALSFSTADFLHLRPDTPASVFLPEVRRYVRERVRNTHEFPETLGTMEAEEIVVEDIVSEDGTSISTEELKATLGVLDSRTNEIHGTVFGAFPILQEELDIAWWVLGQFSRDLEVPFAELDAGPSALIMGKELSDLSRTPLGPAAIRAVLTRNLGQPKAKMSASLEECLRATATTWLSDWSGRWPRSGARPDGLVPITAATWAYADSQTGFEAVYHSSTGLPTDSLARRLLATDIGEQIYLECQLAKLMHTGSE